MCRVPAISGCKSLKVSLQHSDPLASNNSVQNLPGVSCPIFPVHKILNLRSFLLVCNNSDPTQLLHLCNFARVLRSYNALPVLSLCPAAGRGLMASDLMRERAMVNGQLRSMSNGMPHGAATSASWVTRCIASTSSAAAGFHANCALLKARTCCSSSSSSLLHVRLLPLGDLRTLLPTC